MKAINAYVTNHTIHFYRWSNTSYAVFQSIGKQVQIGVITCLLEQLNSVKSSVINYIDGPETEIQTPGEEPEEWNDMLAEDALRTNLSFCTVLNQVSSELSHPGFSQSITYQKSLYAALIGLFLFPAIPGKTQVFLSFYYSKSFNHE